MLLTPVFVELLEEVLVPVLRGGRLVLVLHLEHDRDELGAILVVLRAVVVPEDEIALAAGSRIVVLLEIRMGERPHAHFVEFVLAVPLKRFAHHFRRQSGLEVAQSFDLVITVANLREVFLLLRSELELLPHLRIVEFATQLVSLTFDLAHLFGNLEPLRSLRIVELRLQLLDPHILLGGRFRLLGLQIRLCQLPCRFGIRLQPFHLVPQLVAFLLHIAHRFGHREFLAVLESRQLCLQILELRILLHIGLLEGMVQLLLRDLSIGFPRLLLLVKLVFQLVHSFFGIILHLLNRRILFLFRGIQL